jgi:hypothetical protein
MAMRSPHLVINFPTMSLIAGMPSYHKAFSGIRYRSKIIFLLFLHEVQKHSDDGKKLSVLPFYISEIYCTVVAHGLTVILDRYRYLF